MDQTQFQEAFMAPDSSSIPPDVVFVSIPRVLAQFHHLPEHVPLVSDEDNAPPSQGYDFARGVQAMQHLLEDAPDAPGSYLYRLYVRKWPFWQKAAPLLESGRVAEAIPLLVAVLDVDPDCPLTCFQLGFCFRATGEYEKSETFYKKALTLAPDAGWIHSNLARTYALWGKEDLAKEVFWQALQLLPGDSFILEQLEGLGELVRLSDDPGKPDTARYVKRADFEKKVTVEVRKRTEPREVLNLGFSLLEDKLWDLAEECFERARELDPSAAPALLGLGVAHLHRGHPAESERWLLEYLEREPESVSGHLNLFKVELELDRPEDAWEHLLTAVRLNPGNAGALEQMVHFLTAADRVEEAVMRLSEIVRMHPELAAPWKSLARLHNASGETAEEIKAWEQAYRCSPDEPEILVGYTAALGQDGKPEDVVRLLGPRVDKLPFELTVNLVVALGRLKRPTEARDYLKAFSKRADLSREDRQRAEELLVEWDRQGGTL
jgi:tetratricopeptide (TPR) repeat protein